MKKKMEYLFINVNYDKKTKDIEWYAIKTNEKMQMMSQFHWEGTRIDFEKKGNHQLYLWLAVNPFLKIVTVELREFQLAVDLMGKGRLEASEKTLLYAFNRQYWNLKSEMCYRLGLPNQTPMSTLLSLYGVNFVGDEQKTKDRCYNAITLVSHFLFDQQRNSQLFNGTKLDQKIPLLNNSPKEETVSKEELFLTTKMQEGWHFSIQCHPVQHNVHFVYEVTAWKPTESVPFKKGSGHSLQRVLDRLFTL